MANFGPSKTWTDGEILSHTDLNAALLDIINNVTNNNIDADNIDETDDYTWSGANSFVGGHSIKVLSNAASSIVTGTTLEWDPGDGGQMTDNSSGISLDFKLPDASDNQDVFASIAAICLDGAAGSEDGELSFRVATAGTNTEKMTLSNSALTVTPAITASGGITGSVTSSNATITGGTITGITDIAIADGGTGASTAAAARTNLGLEIGVDVQAYDAELEALSGLTPTDSNIIVGNGSTFVTESGATARTSLGLGSIATQDASAVSITGGSLTGMTSYSGGTISGTTGTFTGALSAQTLTANNGTLYLDDNGSHNGVINVPASLFLNIDSDNGATNEKFQIAKDRSGTSGGTVLFELGESGDLAVNTDTLYIDASADRVGISTSSPQGALHIDGTGGASNQTSQLRFSLGGTTEGIFGVASSAGNIISGSTQGDTVIRNDGGNIHFSTDSGTSIAATLDASGNISLPAGYLKVSGNPSAGTISSNGNGQIGGLTGNGLYMYGKGSTYDLALANANTTVALAIPTGGSATPSVYIPNSLGLGTTSPTTKIHASGASSASALRLDESTSGANSYLGYLDTSGNFGIDVNGGGYLRFAVGGAERARILSSGGITFNGDTATANALDDYEEGTFTPTLGGTTTDPTVTYSIQVGTYTKVGNLVTVTVRFATTALTGGAGYIQIKGLPYTQINSSDSRTMAYTSVLNLDVDANCIGVAIEGAANVTHFFMLESKDNTSWSNVTWTQVTSSSFGLWFTAQYYV